MLSDSEDSRVSHIVGADTVCVGKGEDDSKGEDVVVLMVRHLACSFAALVVWDREPALSKASTAHSFYGPQSRLGPHGVAERAL